MTRSELLKEVNSIIMVTSSKYLDDVIESKNKILDCFDDFESRTCESCKHKKTVDFDDTCNGCIYETNRIDKWESK